MTIELSIVIPAYNEAERLGRSLVAIIEYLRQSGRHAEVIVVDDGSTDDTGPIAAKAFMEAGDIQTKLITVNPNRGKGHAVRTGLLHARGNIAVFSDADLSTPISELPKVVGPIESGKCDIVFGSRALDRSLIGVHQPWRREMGGRVFNGIVRVATGLPFKDTQCGFKAFRSTVCKPILEAATIDRFAFDVELLFIAKLAGLRSCEVPVRWDHNDGSKVNVLRDSWRMFLEVQAIRSRRRKYLKCIQSKQSSQTSDQLKYHCETPV
jgi:glycosyltransferase involved in cell wall biosynthesis